MREEEFALRRLGLATELRLLVALYSRRKMVQVGGRELRATGDRSGPKRAMFCSFGIGGLTTRILIHLPHKIAVEGRKSGVLQKMVVINLAARLI